MHRATLPSALFLCALLTRPVNAADTWVVRDVGVGPVKIGMTLAQLNTTLHEKFTVPTEDADQECFYVKPSAQPHVAFMVEHGRVTRIDVDAPGIATAAGIQVGDLEDKAKKAYGSDLLVGPHYYTEGHYLTVRSQDGQYAIRFETTKQGKITTYYAGVYEAVQYVEGCE